MNSQWQIDLFDGLNNAKNMQDVLDATLKIVRNFGFDLCGWRAKLPLPLNNKHRYSTLNSNEDKVSEQASNGYYDNAPVPKHCSQSIEPISWCGTTEDRIFIEAPDLIEEYYGSGHRGGWAQSLIESKNMFSLFYADSFSILSKKDIEHVDLKMQFVTTAVLSKMNAFRLRPSIKLSEKEKEILRWSGDGKTAWEIGQILSLSNSTINFHLRNAMFKLDAPNKTSAVVRAIYLGLLH